MASPAVMTPPGRVDVHVDVAVRVLAIKEEQLRDDDVGNLVIDGRAEKDDALAQQQRVDVEGALAATRRLDDHGNQVAVEQ